MGFRGSGFRFRYQGVEKALGLFKAQVFGLENFVGLLFLQEQFMYKEK